MYVKYMTRFDNWLQSYKFESKRNNVIKEIFDNYIEIETFSIHSFKTRVSNENEKKVSFVYEIYLFQFTTIWAKYSCVMYL